VVKSDDSAKQTVAGKKRCGLLHEWGIAVLRLWYVNKKRPAKNRPLF
jgi:hypothetical protein